MTSRNHPDIQADSIDRIGPTCRPAERPVMYQSWRTLLFLHWTVPMDVLRPLIPDELEIDTFHGQAYVGLVPFTMVGVRPVWAPRIPPISDFHETNVRTYVHFKGKDPGVWFFSLDAANAIAVRIARLIWKLPYHLAEMSLAAVDSSSGAPHGNTNALSGIDDRSVSINYRTVRRWPAPIPAICDVGFTSSGPTGSANPGTLEHFLAERYLLYTSMGGTLLRGQVHHAPYPLRTAQVTHLEESMIAAAGIQRPIVSPLAHFSPGVDVDIFPLKRVGE